MNSGLIYRTQWETLAALLKSVNIDINNLSNTRQLLALPTPDTNLDQIIAHGVLPRTSESGDDYTYIPDEERKSHSSRHSSVTQVQGDSPNAQSPSPQVKESKAIRSRAKDSPPQPISTTVPIAMPIHPRHLVPPMYWSGQEQQPHETKPQYYAALAGATSSFAPMTLVTTGGQTSGSFYQSQMGRVGHIDKGMGVENMDLDAVSAYWWDQAFEEIAIDQYGFYYDPGYQAVAGEGHYRT